jgi:hypothetical protein
MHLFIAWFLIEQSIVISGSPPKLAKLKKTILGRKYDILLFYNILYHSSITVLLLSMPKPGYKSITVSENIYIKGSSRYMKRIKLLQLRGIASFSGYLTSMMEEMMIKDEVFARYSPFIEKIAVDQNRVILKDRTW